MAKRNGKKTNKRLVDQVKFKREDRREVNRKTKKIADKVAIVPIQNGEKMVVLLK
ncbi:MAG: hypothetical protein WCX46_01950 [Candidatus Paceibacterota bacterium]